MQRAVPAYHDDDDGGVDGHAAHRDWLGRGWRIAAAPGTRRRGRAGLLSAHHAVCDAGGVHLPRHLATSPRAPRTAGVRRGAGRGRLTLWLGNRVDPDVGGDAAPDDELVGPDPRG